MDSSLVIDLAVLTALVTGLVQGVKVATNGKFNNLLPLLADLLGAVGGYLLLGRTPEAVVLGVIAGLSASGAWAQGRAVTQ